MTWGSTDVESPTMKTDEGCERDDLYYFEPVVFKVENTFFRVPKSGLNVEGTVFEAMFALPPLQEDSEHPEGSSDKSPVVLEGISKTLFRNLLRAIYRFTPSPLTFEELAGAIELATMWEFLELRERLIKETSPCIEERPIHEIILLARRCKVKEWLINTYTSLVLKKSRADLLELKNKGIDADTIAKLFFIREEFAVRPCDPTYNENKCEYCGYDLFFGPPTLEDVHSKIDELFSSELADMVSNSKSSFQ